MEGQIELEDYLRSLNCENFDICDYIPKGRANAVTRYELCMKTGFRDRQVRDLIHYARRDGSILNLSDGKRNACSICQAGGKQKRFHRLVSEWSYKRL